MSPAAVLNILVTANTKQANAALASTQSQLRATQATAAKTSAATGAAIAGGVKRGALAMAALGGGAIVAAAQWEDAFADVRKTVDATEPRFAKIETGLRNLAKQIPISATELAHLAGEAGALGVAAKDIVGFTKVAAMLGTTTDLSASEASNALARLGNIMRQKTVKDFQRMGSTLVDLGNKGASTEAEISNMALRIAGAGKTVGLSAKDVLGLAASLSNLGIRAEMGGSAISRVMLEMQSAVAQGGEALGGFAEIAGVSSQQFAKAFAQDPTRAIQLFTDGLGRINKAGGDMKGTLDAVNLGEIRVRDTLLRLSSAQDEVNRGQQIANKAWGENSALAEEANKKYKTTASQFQLLKNRIFDVGITLGEKLLPAVNKVMKRLGKGDLGGAIAAMAELGAKMASKLAGALLKAFWEADALGKLFILGAMIRIIGGKGAILKVGMAIGRLFGLGISAGTVQTTGATGPGGGILGKMKARLPKFTPLGFGIGTAIGAGIIAALIYQKPIEEWAKKHIPKIHPFGSGETSKAAEEVFNAEGTALENLETREARTRKRMLANAGEHFEKMRDATAKHLDQVGNVWDKGGDRVKNESNQDFGQASEKARGHTKKMSQGVVGNVISMAGGVLKGLTNVKDNVNKSLGAFQVKQVSYSLEKVGESLKGFQRGGVMVPGRGSGDKVPAMLEPGEVVINRNAVAAMGGAQRANKINKMVPRFAGGGLVGGLKPGISRLVRFAAQRYGLKVSSGLRPGDAGSFHGSGEAADLVPPSMKATRGIFGAFRNQLAELFYDPWGGWDSGQRIGAIGDHMDHIHAAILGAGAGGPMGAARVPGYKLKGPKGPLRTLGQRGLDRVTHAANAYLSKHSGSMISPDLGGSVKSNMRLGHQMMLGRWPQSEWPGLKGLWMRESGWSETATNPSSGAYGIPQALPASKMGAAAQGAGPAAARAQIKWGLGYIADRYGSPSAADAFQRSNNWYQRGGIVGMQGGGKAGHQLHAKKKAANILSPIQRLGFRANVLEHHRIKGKAWRMASAGVKSARVALRRARGPIARAGALRSLAAALGAKNRLRNLQSAYNKARGTPGKADDLKALGPLLAHERSLIAASAAAEPDQSELVSLLQSQLLSAQQSYAVSQAQYGVLSGTPAAGMPTVTSATGGSSGGGGQWMNTQQPVILIEDGAVDAKRIRHLSGHEAERRLRRHAKRGGQIRPGRAGSLR